MENIDLLNIIKRPIHKNMKNRFLTASAATVFEPVCIAQLIQVELLRRRQSLAQIQGASLSNSRFFMFFVYIYAYWCFA